MGYQINYQNGFSKTEIYRKKRHPKVLIILVTIVIISVVLYSLIPGIKNKLIASSSDPAVTAFSSFMDRVHKGEKFGYAFEAFCKEIVKNADLS